MAKKGKLSQIARAIEAHPLQGTTLLIIAGLIGLGAVHLVVQGYIEGSVKNLLSESYIGISYSDNFNFDKQVGKDKKPVIQQKFIPIYVEGDRKVLLHVDLASQGLETNTRKIEIRLDDQLIVSTTKDSYPNPIDLSDAVKKSKSGGTYTRQGENIHTIAFRNPEQASNEAVTIKTLVNIYGLSK